MKGKFLVTAQFILLGTLFLAPSIEKRPTVIILMSALLLGLAIYLLLRSFRDLGDALTPLPESKEGAELVTSGIYHRLRHPIYSALFVLSAGIVTWKQSLLSLIVSLMLGALLIHKSRYEDSLLLKKFPDAATYQSSTPAFFPRLKRG